MYDLQDQKILNRIQQSIPFSPAPFQDLGLELQLSEGQLIDRIRSLKGCGIIRQISGIFDAVSLGYETALVAMKISPERLSQAVAVINEHPGVSHNYLRDYSYNLWFTIAVYPNGVGLEAHVKFLSERVFSQSTLLLPALRLYKIGAQFDVSTDRGSGQPASDDFYTESSRPLRPLMPWEKKIVLALQEDLPPLLRPFIVLAKKAGLTEETLIEGGKRLQQEGFLRRFAAVVRHQKVGFHANVMTVWEIPGTRVDEMGFRFARFPFVTHCYLRPTYPGWPYNLFAMIHGRNQEECRQEIERMKKEARTETMIPLASLKEYKKVRTRYFTPDQEEWEKKGRSCVFERKRTSQSSTAVQVQQ